jgi:hypothetical protein
MNTHQRDNTAWLATDKPHALVFNGSAVSTTTAVALALNAGSEVYDTGAMHSTISNTSRITIPSGAGGVYLVTGGISFDANATGTREIRILKNGSTIKQVTVGAAPSGNTNLTISRGDLAVATDFYEIAAVQTSGGNLNVTLTDFAVHWHATS